MVGCARTVATLRDYPPLSKTPRGARKTTSKPRSMTPPCARVISPDTTVGPVALRELRTTMPAGYAGAIIRPSQLPLDGRRRRALRPGTPRAPRASRPRRGTGDPGRVARRPSDAEPFASVEPSPTTFMSPNPGSSRIRARGLVCLRPASTARRRAVVHRRDERAQLCTAGPCSRESGGLQASCERPRRACRGPSRRSLASR